MRLCSWGNQQPGGGGAKELWKVQLLMHEPVCAGSTPRCSPPGGYSARDRVVDL
jgi:hypothetical protein